MVGSRRPTPFMRKYTRNTLNESATHSLENTSFNDVLDLTAEAYFLAFTKSKNGLPPRCGKT